MKPGEVSGVMRSSTGFHIVKLMELRSRNQPTVVEQTHPKHILIKVNEVTSESDGKIKIDRIRDRIDGARNSTTGAPQFRRRQRVGGLG
jgi:peptidyl-prolyl cis-trans isomerase SurA